MYLKSKAAGVENPIGTNKIRTAKSFRINSKVSKDILKSKISGKNSFGCFFMYLKEQ